MNVHILKDPYITALLTEIRDEQTSKETLRKRLSYIGRRIGELIIGDGLVLEKTVTTPLGLPYTGLCLSKTTTLIVSTRDDYHYYANGIASCFSKPYRGFMDFDRVRGPEALKCKRRAIEFPTVKPGEVVDTLIIAKSILATGCTAISLTHSAIARFLPKRVIIAAVFYSEDAIQEVLAEIPNVENIYICGEPDLLNADGLLVPGVGNLDARIRD